MLTRGPRPPGRPRSETTRRAILEAALALASQEAYAAITVDRIAARARVGKQSIYRWWTSKADVLLEAFADREDAESASQKPQATDSHVLAMLEAALRGLAARDAHPDNAQLLRCLMAEAQLDSELAAGFDAKVLAPRRGRLSSMIEGGRSRGELRADLDVDATVDLLLGALWYRVVTGRTEDAGTFGSKVVEFLAPSLTASARVRPPMRNTGVFEA